MVTHRAGNLRDPDEQQSRDFVSDLITDLRADDEYLPNNRRAKPRFDLNPFARDTDMKKLFVRIMWILLILFVTSAVVTGVARGIAHASAATTASASKPVALAHAAPTATVTVTHTKAAPTVTVTKTIENTKMSNACQLSVTYMNQALVYFDAFDSAYSNVGLLIDNAVFAIGTKNMLTINAAIAKLKAADISSSEAQSQLTLIQVNLQTSLALCNKGK